MGVGELGVVNMGIFGGIDISFDPELEKDVV
jgi:hypothetical protein